MKILFLLTLLFVSTGLQAEDSFVQYYGRDAEVAPDYEFKKASGTLWLIPYQYEPFWFKGVRTEGDIVMRPRDHFSRLRDGCYHQYYFNGPEGNKLSFTHKTFTYQLGPNQHQQQEVIVLKQVKLETFRANPEFALVIDYEIYLEAAPWKKMWKTKSILSNAPSSKK